MGGRRLWLAVLAVVVVLLAGTVAWAAQRGDDAPPDPVRYVNLGDSYSAGTGIVPFAEGAAAQCSQSEANWAHELATEHDLRLTDVSCSGAQTKDLRTSQSAGVAPQLDALSPDTDLVTLTIGGNDADVFTRTIASCGVAAARTYGAGNPCERQYGTRFADTVERTTYPRIVQALRDVRAKAPNARVAIAGYLRILPADRGCFPTMPIAAGDVAYLDGIQAALNDAVARAAAATGATFVDVTGISTGHDACQPPGTRWVEPYLNPVNAAPVHPNVAGEKAMAARTAEVLGL
ncbi:SGNH/GDSL hydrolase family protein [Actinomycetospora atypica]|uniref:SGNH/GDSL hydrolase family protein n=1 Tax=Actinomycetospora atypica TaxID=1290095 RepID=A0ABV9YWN9_9PSEU